MNSRLVLSIAAGFLLFAVVFGAAFAVILGPASGMLRPAQVAAAETPGPANQPTIIVSGVGEAKAQPDVAYVNVGVQSRGDTAQEAQAETSRLMADVLAKLKSMQIEDKDIQTSGVSVWPIYDQTPDKISGYVAGNSVNVTVNEIGRAGEILDGAIAAGANSAGGVSFGIKDPSQLRLQALGDAVKNARPKADVIAQAMSVEIKGVQSVTETTGYGPIPMESAKMAMADGRGAVAPVEPGELTITAQVSVVYTY